MSISCVFLCLQNEDYNTINVFLLVYSGTGGTGALGVGGVGGTGPAGTGGAGLLPGGGGLLPGGGDE